MKGPLKRSGLLLGLVATMALLANACGAAEEPTPATTAPVPPTPTRVAPTPTATAQPAVRATATPAPAPTATAAPAVGKRGGIARYSGSDPRNLDPAQSAALPDLPYHVPMLQGLTRVDEGNNLVPMLAKSWEIGKDNSITFKLQDGVKFHDGTAFNAQAVKFNIDRMLDKDFASIWRPRLLEIKAVEPLDDLTVRFNLNKPQGLLLTDLGDRLGMINSPTAVRKTTKAEYTRAPVGTGPFKFKKWVSDSHVEFDRFDSYWEQGRPYLDGIFVRNIQDASVELAAFRAGELDAMTFDGQLYGLVKDLPYAKVVTLPGQSYSYLALNPTLKPLDDLKVRQAVALAFDRSALVTGLYAGRSEAIWAPIAPSFTWAHDLKFAPSYGRGPDAAKAKKLLEEAGYPKGFKLGPMYSCNATTTQARAASAYKAMLAEAGVDLDIQLTPCSVGSTLFQVEWKGMAYLSGYGNHTDPLGPMVEHYALGSPKNVGNVTAPGLQDLLDKALAAYDLQERGKLIRQASQIIADNVLGKMYLTAQYTDWLVRNSLQDWKPQPAGLHYWGAAWISK